MKPGMFAELLASANEALEHTKGQRTLKSISLPRTPQAMTAEQVRHVRKTLQASQAVFACYLNVSTKLVQAWEGSRRAPDGPALVLLRMLEKEPALVDTFLSIPTTTKRRSGNLKRGANSVRSKSRTVVAKIG